MSQFIRYTEETTARSGSKKHRTHFVNLEHVAQAIYDEDAETLTLHFHGPWNGGPRSVTLKGDEAKAALAVLQQITE